MTVPFHVPQGRRAQQAPSTCDTSASGCYEGLAEYKADFVDPLVKTLAEYNDKVPMVVVLEPNSLGSVLAKGTFSRHSRCNAATVESYEYGVEYAAKQISVGNGM